eukprot:TRINITY_DN13216_c3_g1_i1.p1 TRINITY_DN13216_c3_g1~~TRINITY_DN13216_c3_g1_i1.p1  ORF type:complete len:136 (-),score=0.65 TRINITY_DN13216_c3_g1_i1:544-951(-)
MLCVETNESSAQRTLFWAPEIALPSYAIAILSTALLSKTVNAVYAVPTLFAAPEIALPWNVLTAEFWYALFTAPKAELFTSLACSSTPEIADGFASPTFPETTASFPTDSVSVATTEVFLISLNTISCPLFAVFV